MTGFKEWHAIAASHAPHELREALNKAAARWVTTDAEPAPTEYDRLLRYQTVEVAGLAAHYERWVWDGITGSTLIFASADVSHLADESLRELVEGAGYDVGSETTRTERDGRVFFNFGFEA